MALSVGKLSIKYLVLVLRYLLPVVLLVFAVWTFSPYLGDFQKIYQIRYSLNAWWILVAILIQVIQYAADGYFIKGIFGILKFNIRVKDAIRVSALDVFAIRLLPFGRFGSLAAFFYFYRKLGVSTHVVVYLNLVLSFVTVTVLTFLFLVSSTTLHYATFPVPLNIYFLGIVAVLAPILLVVLLLVLKVGEFRRFIDKFLRRFAWYLSLGKSISKIQGFRELIVEQRGKFIALAVSKDLSYSLCDLVILESCFLAFGKFVPIPLLAFAYVVSLTAGTVSLLPGGLGATDAVLGIIFVTAKVDPVVTVGVILLLRLISFILPGFLGAVSYYWLKADLDGNPK